MAMDLQQQFDRPVLIPNIISYDDWLASFKEEWRQGEHVSIIGPTGTGKTTIAHSILEARDYACVLAVKRFDDTLQRFKYGHRYGLSKYQVVRHWPPEFNQQRVIFWQKPTKIEDQHKVAESMHTALNDIYRSGGWALYADDTGYLAGSLGLGRALVVLLNQGRSANLSIVCAIQRPKSLLAKVPVEAVSQVRHCLIFKFTSEDEIKSCGLISGIGYQEMRRMQYNLHVDEKKGYSDFLYIGHGKIQVVRNVV
jgi:energy-coupling factor transporter ATP-binding protein EcfA2